MHKQITHINHSELFSNSDNKSTGSKKKAFQKAIQLVLEWFIMAFM